MDLLINNLWIFLVIIIWTIPWKAIALWRSARNKQLAWFLIIFFVNTVAILEIVYLIFFSKNKEE